MILPLAIIILLISSVGIYNIGKFMIDKMNINNNAVITSLAERQAENALVYGIFMANNKASDGGHKCEAVINNMRNGEFETTNEDKGMKSDASGYIIRRYVTLKGTENWNNAVMTGISRIYDGEGKLKAEQAVQMNMNMLYRDDGTSVSDPCQADTIQMKKTTWHIVR